MSEHDDIKPEQVKAARALLRLEQEEVARRASVSVSTIRRLEAAEGLEYVAPETVETVRAVLEEAGVEFIHDGVRKISRRGKEEIARRIAETNKIVERFAAYAKATGLRPLTDDDLYDEHGLPK